MEILADVGRGRFAAQSFGPRDGPFVRELVLGVLRRRLTLDSIHDTYGKRPAAKLDPPVLDAVRIGLYQMMFMDGVPPHAALSETVEVVRGPGRGYVNALLRTLQRESHKVAPEQDRGGASPRKRLERRGRSVTFFSREVFPNPEQDQAAYLAVLHSHPVFLVSRWLERDGVERTVERMEAANRPAPINLRPRAGRVTAEQLVEALARDEVATRIVERELGAAAVRVEKGAERMLKGAAFRSGLFSVQDVAQMDAAELLAPRPGEVIWDACAAPGGKATHLGELALAAGDDARVVATDASGERLERVDENVTRLGLTDVVRTGVFDLLSDETPPGCPERGFDAILIDAPCSNSAVLGPRPEARWRLRPDTFEELAGQQRKLLDAAVRRLAPGGRLIYSTCSLEPEEGSGHGLQPTRSPLVWVAPAPDAAT